MGFKQIARDVAASAKEMMDAPFNLVKERMVRTFTNAACLSISDKILA